MFLFVIVSLSHINISLHYCSPFETINFTSTNIYAKLYETWVILSFFFCFCLLVIIGCWTGEWIQCIPFTTKQLNDDDDTEAMAHLAALVDCSRQLHSSSQLALELLLLLAIAPLVQLAQIFRQSTHELWYLGQLCPCRSWDSSCFAGRTLDVRGAWLQQQVQTNRWIHRPVFFLTCEQTDKWISEMSLR